MVHYGMGNFGAFPEPFETFQIYHRPLWAKDTIPYFIWFTPLTHIFHKGIWISMQNLSKLIQTSVSCVNIMLFKGKVWANFKIFGCSRSFQCWFQLNGKVWPSMAGFLNQVNRPSESNFRDFQNLVNEHSLEGVPASLHNQTKSVSDPLDPKCWKTNSVRLAF